MNAGLANLATLKAWLLASALQSGTDYDAQIAAIGKGVVGAFEAFCHRKFARTVGDTFDCPANRDHIALPRYPLESVASVQIREADESSFVALTAASIVNQGEAAGLLYFDAEPGTYRDRLRITYTGGYFIDTLEPDAIGYPTALPAGATAVPEALLLAWRLQCEHLWTQRDKLGLQLAKDQEASSALAGIELLPFVKEALTPFRRLAPM